MRGTNTLSTRTALTIIGAAMMLGGCSGRDTASSEQLAEINAAAARAEKAAERAEAAAAKASKAGQATVVDAVPETNDMTEEGAIAAQNEPVDPAADVRS